MTYWEDPAWHNRYWNSLHVLNDKTLSTHMDTDDDISCNAYWIYAGLGVMVGYTFSRIFQMFNVKNKVNAEVQCEPDIHQIVISPDNMLSMASSSRTLDTMI